LAEIRALEDVILPEQSWWCGWFEGDFFGYPLLAYQYPLGKSTVALLDFLLPGDLVLTYKLVLLSAWIFPAWVVAWWFSREGRIGWGILSALTVFASQDHLYLALAGMWNQYLGLGFLLLFFSSVHSTDKGIRLSSAAPWWLGLSYLAHPFSLLPASLLLAAIPLAARNATRLEAVKQVLFATVTATLLTSWYWLPIFLTRNWPRVLPKQWSWSLLNPLFPLTATEIAGPEPDVATALETLAWDSGGMLSALALALLAVWAVWRRAERPANPTGLRLWLTVGALLWGFLLWMVFVPPQALSDVAGMVRIGRFSPYVLAWSLWWAGTAMTSLRPSAIRRLTVTSLPAVATILLNSATAGGPARVEFRALLDTEHPANLQERALVETWRHLAASHNQVPAGRLLVQDTLYNISEGPLARSHVMALTWWQTGRWTIGSFCEAFSPTTDLARTEAGRLLGRSIKDWKPDDLERTLRRQAVTTVVTCEPELTQLLHETSRFRPTFASGPFHVFEADEPAVWWRSNQAVSLVAEQWSQSERILQRKPTPPTARTLDEEVSLLYPPDESTETSGRPEPNDLWLTLPTTFHPWWTAKADGIRTKVLPGSQPAELQVLLPNDARRLTLRFKPPRLLPGLITLLGFLLWIATYRPSRGLRFAWNRPLRRRLRSENLLTEKGTLL